MLLEKLAALEARYNELNLWLSQPDALSDQAKWRDALKEQAELEEAVSRYHEYQKVLEDLEAAREMLESGDPELEELAKEEMGELERQRSERRRRSSCCWRREGSQ